jgi:multidrug efflux system outer membrane protein
MMLRTRVGLLAAVALLGGCGLTKDYHRPDLDLPGGFSGSSADAAQPSLATLPWQQVYTDPALQTLIEEALRNGPDGMLAAAQVRAAAAAAGIARAGQLPNVGLALQTSPTARMNDAHLTSTFLGGVSASWEIDLWGRYARATEAARADWLASRENLRGVTAVQIANVANLYYQLATLHGLEQVAQSVAAAQSEGLRLIRETAKAGINTAAEERQQESALAATEANLPPLRQQVTQAENALAVLLGRTPGSLQIAMPADLPLPASLPAGLPSALLERRPDILAAEAQLHAAHARVEVAKAMFFPDISLTGFFGGVSTSLADVLHGRAATVASLGPNILQPLFAGGALTFNHDAALAQLDQALIVYRRTVNAALADVANNLSAYTNSTDQVAIEARRVFAAREALRLAQLRFRSGVTSFLELLDAQRQQLASQSDALNSQLQQRQALINAYLALGGGS